eukprot:37446-Eustigmatos_ZCMA.PRE.1
MTSQLRILCFACVDVSSESSVQLGIQTDMNLFVNRTAHRQRPQCFGFAPNGTPRPGRGSWCRRGSRACDLHHRPRRC